MPLPKGCYPEWELGIQVFDQDFADSLPYDVLDATKLIPEELLPVKIIGRLVLDRNPDNFFAETEKVAFLPTNIVPGIDFSDDPLLQGRLFSYMDTQKSRLGTTNFHQIPINAPRCPMHNFQRDGMMQTMVPKGRANYEPNSLSEAGEDGGPRASDQGFTTLAHMAEPAAEKLRIRAKKFADHFSQTRMFYLSQTKVEQGHIAAALVFELSKVKLDHVRRRVLGQLHNVDEDLAAKVADGLALELSPAVKPAREPVDLDTSDALSILKKTPVVQGRSLGLLVTDGADDAAINAVQEAAQKAGATVKIIAPKVGGITTKAGKALPADEMIDGAPSVLFDAVALVVSKAGAETLLGEKAALDFVSDAFAHCKAIGHTGEAMAFFNKVGVVPDDWFFELPDGAPSLTKKLAERNWDREAKVKRGD